MRPSRPRLVLASAWLVLLVLVCAPQTQARVLLQLFVSAPYLELHTGPGRGYPVTQVIARGEALDVLFRRTDWYKVRSERGVEGWASAQDLSQAQLADGSQFNVRLGTLADFATHRWETGAFVGDFGGATELSLYQGMALTPSLKLDVTVNQFIGNFTSGYLLDLGVEHVFLPTRRLSPIVMLGGGWERSSPRVTLANSVQSNYQDAWVGVGARLYLARHLFLRGEYRNRDVFISSKSSEVTTEWKIGFGYFY